MNVAQLRRDPFARATLMRATVPVNERRACAWCGSRDGRYRYRWEPDSVRPCVQPWTFQPAFCSIDCWHSGGGRA